MGFLCRGPSCRGAFYPDHRPGVKCRRQGFLEFHNQAGPGAPTRSGPRGGTIGAVRAETRARHRVTATVLENRREIEGAGLRPARTGGRSLAAYGGPPDSDAEPRLGKPLVPQKYLSAHTRGLTAEVQARNNGSRSN